MAVANYVTIDGMLIGEYTNGVMRNYGTGALGSVVTTSLNGVPENTYRYKPYGGLLAKTGTAADPSFLWNRGSGYRATALADASHYVRRQHHASVQGRWTTVDRMWPLEPEYVYVHASPVLLADPSGRGSDGTGTGAPPPRPTCCCQALGLTQTSFNLASPGDGMTKIFSVFKFVVKPPTTPAGAGRLCTATWLEKTNDPIDSAIPKDHWYNIASYPLAPAFPDLIPRETADMSNCPGPVYDHARDYDPPEYVYDLGHPVTRCLCLMIIITSGCDGSNITQTPSQTVSYANGSTPRVAYPSDPYTDQYCAGTLSYCPQR